MASKTFVPAFQARVGNWTYYTCLMSYAQVAREINFAYELGGNQDLSTMIQRGVGSRTIEITEYLLSNENRFLGAIIVAAWGGNPNYLPLTMDEDADNQVVLEGIDRNFGVLTFDGTQQFFALDGQHRLRAIKDAVKKDPDLGSEDITVIVVPHFDTPEGRRRTRRLFTNINRNAKTTTAQENIALDEDDSFAILTRRLIDEDDFLSRDKAVLVFSKVGEEGQLTLAQRAIAQTSPAWSTIGVLYDVVKELGFDMPCNNGSRQRVEDDLLDESYDMISARLSELLDACGNLKQRYQRSPSPRELRAPKGREGSGHPFMRPVVQVQVAKAVHTILENEWLAWPELTKRLGELEWKISAAPFSSVWIEGEDGNRGKMAAGSDNSKLLYDLLLVHLAPRNKSQITRALRSYSELMRSKYPVAAETLFASLPASTEFEEAQRASSEQSEAWNA